MDNFVIEFTVSIWEKPGLQGSESNSSINKFGAC